MEQLENYGYSGAHKWKMIRVDHAKVYAITNNNKETSLYAIVFNLIFGSQA